MKSGIVKTGATVCMSLFMVIVTGCLDEQAPGNYYTFTGETVSDFLTNREDYFSSFIEILKRARLWGGDAHLRRVHLSCPDQ